MKIAAIYRKIIPVELSYILKLFLFTRIILTVIGAVSRSVILPIFKSDGIWPPTKCLAINTWVIWDSNWYLRIAEQWYLRMSTVTGQTNFGFPPLYPLLIRILGTVIKSNVIAGLFISNASLLITGLFLYRLVKLDSNDNALALRTVKYLFLAPAAFILSGVFTESLYLALAVMIFYYAQKKKWLLVGILGLFLPLARPIGIFIIVPLLYEYYKNINFKFRETKINLLLIVFLVPLGALIFLAYTYYLTGDWQVLARSKAIGWGCGIRNPFRAIFEALVNKNILSSLFGYFTLASLAAMCFFIRKIRFSQWIFGMYSIVLPPAFSMDAGQIFAMMRFLLPAFPLYMICAGLCKDSHIDEIITIFLALAQGALMVIWSAGLIMV
jgi:hypothetical protein